MVNPGKIRSRLGILRANRPYIWIFNWIETEFDIIWSVYQYLFKSIAFNLLVLFPSGFSLPEVLYTPIIRWYSCSYFLASAFLSSKHRVSYIFFEVLPMLTEYSPKIYFSWLRIFISLSKASSYYSRSMRFLTISWRITIYYFSPSFICFIRVDAHIRAVCYFSWLLSFLWHAPLFK